MAEHTIETRILLRYDTLQNWTSSTVILKQGEAAIAVSSFDYTIEGTNNRPNHTPPAVGIKVGDGYHYFSELPWVQAVAGDVYNWAKQQTKPSYNANEIQGLTALIQQCIEDAGGGGGSGGGGEVTVQARLYRLIKGTGDNSDKYYLQSKTVDDTTWTTDELNYIDLSDLARILTWMGDAAEYWNLGGYLAEKINDSLSSINYTDTPDATKVVTAVHQTNGKIRVVRDSIGANNISGIITVEHGGTGQNSFESDSVLVGNGTGNILSRPIDNVLLDNNNLATGHAIVAYVDNATAGITGAMHYIGEARVEITNGSNVNPRIENYDFIGAQPGDVIIYNQAEYVWTGAQWRLIGDEGSYAIKGSIVNRDIAADANIDQSKIADLTSSLESKVDKEEGKGLSSNNYTNDDKNKLSGIEENAQRNIIEHVYVNGTEVVPTTIEGNENSLGLRVSALTPEEEEKIEGIEPQAQVNRIEHIFLNEEELAIKTVKNLAKSVNIELNKFTTEEKEKLAGIEPQAQQNTIEKIFFNDTQFTPNEEKEVHVTIDTAALDLDVLEGAQVPGDNLPEEVSQVNKKLQLARIAKTGNVVDLLQSNDEYITLYCGTSTEVI